MQRGKAFGDELLETVGGPLSPEALYQLNIKLEGTPTDNQVNQFVAEFERKYGVKVTYVKSHSKTLVLQFQPSHYVPMEFLTLTGAFLIANLPAILSVIGLVLVGVSLFYVVTALPTWVWVLLIVGISLLFFSPFTSGMFKSTVKQGSQIIGKAVS